MTEEQIKKFYSLCDSLGIRKFNNIELGIGFAQLKNEILIGLKRKSKVFLDDGGLAAIDSDIKPITFEQLKHVPAGTQVIYGAYAGTNWVTGLATKVGETIVEQKLVVKSFLNRKERQFSSREEFAAMVAGQIKEALQTLGNGHDIRAVAISFGFPQNPVNCSYGRDAEITTDHLTKSWFIKGGTGMRVGKYVLESLKRDGLAQFKYFYFANDTTAVALDVSAKSNIFNADKYESLAAGFVMGTGDNGSAIFKGYKNDNLVNLEIGSAVGLGTDETLSVMMKKKLTPTNTPIIEYYMGGDYLLSRLACSFSILQERGATKKNFDERLLQFAQGAKITSRLAARDVVAEELSELFKIKVFADDLFMLNEVARRVISKGAQAAGEMVSAVASCAGWDQDLYGAIPIEGTVFSQGFGFREGVRKTMKLLIPKHKLTFVPGSGTRGISSEAMVRINSR